MINSNTPQTASDFILPLSRVLRHRSWVYFHWWECQRSLWLSLGSLLHSSCGPLYVWKLVFSCNCWEVIVEGFVVPSYPLLLYAKLVQWLQDWTWAEGLMFCGMLESTAKQMEVCDPQSSVLVEKCLKRALLLVFYERFLYQVSGHGVPVHYGSSSPGCSAGWVKALLLSSLNTEQKWVSGGGTEDGS